jgi:two-component system, chemotaxis family, protein-glutamate methylesterase/glutaminase
LRLGHGAKENGHRPAIDPLFYSAAHAYRSRVVGILLSGNRHAGTAGLQQVQQQGGCTMVQDPEEALYPGMRRSAVENLAVDHVLPLSDMARVLLDLVQRPVEGEGAVEEDRAIEAALKQWQGGARPTVDPVGTPAGFTCPECRGPLWETQQGPLVRFACLVGHGFSLPALAAEKAEAVEAALWSAVAALQEDAALARRAAARLQQDRHPLAAAQFEERAHDKERRAATIRELIVSSPPDPVDAP